VSEEGAVCERGLMGWRKREKEEKEEKRRDEDRWRELSRD